MVWLSLPTREANDRTANRMTNERTFIFEYNFLFFFLFLCFFSLSVICRVHKRERERERKAMTAKTHHDAFYDALCKRKSTKKHSRKFSHIFQQKKKT